jgi:hypothetical protein
METTLLSLMRPHDAAEQKRKLAKGWQRARKHSGESMRVRKKASFPCSVGMSKGG